MEKKPILNDMPIFYTYQDKEGWKRTDASTTKEINRAFIMRKDGKFDTCKFSFYPQWRAPNDANERKVAWRITAEGQQVARWNWCECEHKTSHRQCEPIGNGMCKVRKLLMLRYDPNVKMWIRA